MQKRHSSIVYTQLRLSCVHPSICSRWCVYYYVCNVEYNMGSMSRLSKQILICFIAYIFHFYSSLVWLGTLQDSNYAQCPLQLSIVIRMRLVIRQSKLPGCLADVQLAHEKTLSVIYATGLVKLTDKWMKSVSMGSFQYKNQVNKRVFCIAGGNFTAFQPRI